MMFRNLRNGFIKAAIAVSVLMIFCISDCHAAAKESAPAQKPSSGKGTDFAAKEQNTERLQALRKRVAEYERAISLGIEPPAVESAEPLQRREPGPPREISPRTSVLQTLQKNPMDKGSLDSLKHYLTTASNSQDKAMLGTLYCLGCLATDQWGEGTRISIRMRRAYPNDTSVKLLSLETFVAPCKKCSGVGKQSAKCTRCKGKKKCPFLGCAKGVMSNPDFAVGGKSPKCPMCGGSGECKNCKGTGTVEVLCNTCSATGKLLSLDSIEQGYVRLLRTIKP